MWDNLENVDTEYSDFDINVYGNTAVVFHDSQWSGKFQGEEQDVIQTRILHLVKVEGEWKLDLMVAYRIPEEEDPNEEDQIQ